MRTPDMLLRRARIIHRTEGWMPLATETLRFLAGCFYARQRYYLFKHSMEDIARLNEADFMPKTDNYVFRIVSSNRDSDSLRAEGLDLRADMADSEQRLESGAVAFCIFAGKELAHVSWVAMTQEAKDSLNEPPCKVAFGRGEAWTGGAWTNPRHRRMRFFGYADFKRHQFMGERGIGVSRTAMAISNLAPQASATKKSMSPYAETRLLKVLWWKSWKETPLASPEGDSSGKLT